MELFLKKLVIFQDRTFKPKLKKILKNPPQENF